MRKRTGDWRDVLSAYALALDSKKLWMGFIGTLATVLTMMVASMVYGVFFPQSPVSALGEWGGKDFMPLYFMVGQGVAALKAFSPLLNPFHAGIVHFCISILFYVVLLAWWSYFGGVITRLTALEYGRDELPMLKDGIDMVRRKRKAYFFAPIFPLVALVLFALANALGGLIGSIPYVGPIVMIFPGIPMWFMSTGILVFIVVLSVLSFGMMLPTVSIGGKDAFEGFSSAYSYILWGFGRFLGYAVIGAVVGIISTIAVWAVCELFIYALLQTIEFGFIGKDSLVVYQAVVGGKFGPAIWPTESTSVLMRISSVCMLVALLAVRALPMAYLFSYFFVTNTVICFLMRKHVDRIELDEVFEEKPEEEEEAEEEKVEVEEEEKPQAEEKVEETAEEKAEEKEEKPEESEEEGGESSAEEEEEKKED